MRFAIVTPVLNGEKFVDQSILSVVSQTGPFTIRYHVQDGGSKDRTLEILAAWQTRLARDFPVFCEGIEFSFASAPDRGPYDAVNRGFAACAGSDDRFEPGAFATVGEIFRDFPDIDWVTGRTTNISEAGPMLSMPPPIIPFPRKAIAAGIFDGRFAPLASSKKPRSGGRDYGKRPVASIRISGLPVTSIFGGVSPDKLIS